METRNAFNGHRAFVGRQSSPFRLYSARFQCVCGCARTFIISMPLSVRIRISGRTCVSFGSLVVAAMCFFRSCSLMPLALSHSSWARCRGVNNRAPPHHTSASCEIPHTLSSISKINKTNKGQPQKASETPATTSHTLNNKLTEKSRNVAFSVVVKSIDCACVLCACASEEFCCCSPVFLLFLFRAADGFLLLEQNDFHTDIYRLGSTIARVRRRLACHFCCCCCGWADGRTHSDYGAKWENVSLLTLSITTYTE